MLLGTTHIVVLAVYLLAVLGIGFAFMRQKDTEDFFVAGRSFSWWPVALSVMASNFSAISLMGVPGFVYKQSLQPTLALLICLPIVLPFVIFLFLRFFQSRHFVSAYQYLEARFHVSLRMLGAALFVFLRLAWLATVIYVPSLAIGAVTGVPLLYCIWGVGLFATLYTMAGGMRAVIWTDVLQFFAMVVGMVGMAVVILARFDWSFGRVWSVAAASGHTKLADFRFDLTDNMSFWGLLFGYVFIMLASYGVDQLVVQRYLSTRDFKQGARSVMGTLASTLPVLLMLAFLGVGLFAFYQTSGSPLPDELNPAFQDVTGAGGKVVYKPDYVLPIFMMTHLPAVIGGLMLAALFSATMSSIDSGINSLTCICVVDFYKRVKDRFGLAHDEKRELLYSRIGTFLWGAIATVIAMFVDRLGTIFEISTKTNSFFTGCLLGLFLLGVLFERVNTMGGVIGVVFGLYTVIAVATVTDISYWWLSPIGCVATVAFGALGSYLDAPPSEAQTLGLTLRSVESPAAESETP